MVLWAGKVKIIYYHRCLCCCFCDLCVCQCPISTRRQRYWRLLSQESGGGLSSALGQLGGLASLAGVSIGGGESSESQIAQEIMKSWSFVEGFIADNDLAVEVYRC